MLIVIDTLQRIRGGVNDANPYASDYRDLGILKELAGVIDGKESIHPRQSSRLGKIRDLRERQKSPDDRSEFVRRAALEKEVVVIFYKYVERRMSKRFYLRMPSGPALRRSVECGISPSASMAATRTSFKRWAA